MSKNNETLLIVAAIAFFVPFFSFAQANQTTLLITPSFSRNLSVGTRGVDVSELQMWLIAKGFSLPYGASGYFGTQTKKALAAYQAANGITPAVGYFGSITRATINTRTTNTASTLQPTIKPIANSTSFLPTTTSTNISVPNNVQVSAGTLPPQNLIVGTGSKSVSVSAAQIPSTNSVPSNISDNFLISAGIQPFDNGGSLQGKIADVSTESVGAFRITCRSGQLLTDDPVVYFGVHGASHLHQFSGNKGTNADTTYTTLRTSGGTNCGTDDAPVNRSAYWFPAMLDGVGNVVKPDYFNIYYKQLPNTNPNCLARSEGCVPLPNGLKFITGWNPVTMTGGPDGSTEYFECWYDDINSLKVQGTSRATSIDALVRQGCPPGALLVAQIVSQTCWDGKNIDSRDHRSHVAYNEGTGINVGDINGGGQKCPAGWFLIPQIFVRMVFTTDANFAAGKWRLSSDSMMPAAPAGSTLHFDYMEGWSPIVKATWQKNCIDDHRTCSEGDLGNGTQIKGIGPPLGGWLHHQLVPLSSLSS